MQRLAWSVLRTIHLSSGKAAGLREPTVLPARHLASLQRRPPVTGAASLEPQQAASNAEEPFISTADDDTIAAIVTGMLDSSSISGQLVHRSPPPLTV